MNTDTALDLDSLLWARRLIIVGFLFNGVYVGSSDIDYRIGDVGTLIVLGGIMFLYDTTIGRTYIKLIQLLIGLCILRIGATIAGYFPAMSELTPVTLILSIVGISSELAFIIVFPRAMLKYATHYELTGSLQTWKTSFKLGLLLYTIPAFILATGFIILSSIAPPGGWHFSDNNAGFAVVLAFFLGIAVVFAIILLPIIHQLISYARTVTEAKTIQANIALIPGSTAQAK